MKEEVHVNHSKLLSSASAINFNLLDHKDLDPDFKKQIPFDALFNHKTSKFSLSKLSSVDKLKWLLNADSVIDFALTYPIIESLHETNYFKTLIDSEINGNELSVSIEALELSLGIEFKDHNYQYYLHFNTANKPLLMPVLVKTKDLIKNIQNYSYTKQDFFFSVPFFNSLIDLAKSKKIKLSFVTFSSPKGHQTVGIKAQFEIREDQKYYDISHNPPTGDKLEGESGYGTGSPLGLDYIFI